ncbi:hypothetical protein C5O80_23000 [Burkholderia sp. SRS-46]|nr:hypothetical protein C5O80_23000 [Burkholderia sp. SRS-46]
MEETRFGRLVTLTYRQPVTDGLRAECDCLAFRTELERQGLASAGWLRRHQSGWLSLHFAVDGRVDYRALRVFWRNLVDGGVHVLRLRDPEKLGPYLANEVRLY